MEIWKKIDEYPNYSVSSEGRVRNDKTGTILKPCYHNGYQQVTLYKNGKVKNFYIHRLVAQAFLPNPNNLPCVDHINTIRSDNRAENLRWVTHKENCNNPLTLEKKSETRTGKQCPEHSERMRGENNPQARKIILLNTGEVFDYIKQASEKYRINYGNICLCCKGERKFAGLINGKPAIWMYYSDYEKLSEEEIEMYYDEWLNKN